MERGRSVSVAGMFNYESATQRSIAPRSRHRSHDQEMHCALVTKLLLKYNNIMSVSFQELDVCM